MYVRTYAGRFIGPVALLVRKNNASSTIKRPMMIYMNKGYDITFDFIPEISEVTPSRLKLSFEVKKKNKNKKQKNK